VSVGTARWCAEWADGLITVNQPVDVLRELIDAYRGAGGRGKLHLQVHLSYDPDEQRAEEIAHDQWRSNSYPPPVSWDLDRPELFDIVTEDVSTELLRSVVHISSDLGRHAAQLAEYAELGFDEIALHHVGQEQDGFVDAFGAEVLPQLKALA
jgi:alkanesulfonate monooxygenase SsuD/methylene tetrahydromethanopterin reductase-like flavin-dependent oxidoreductase (luciferase family)